MPQNYHITGVEDTSFDPDQYGNRFYSIRFEGTQNSILWKTKNRPETGTTVYGHIEPSKSGKSSIFKKDKLEDAPTGGDGGNFGGKTSRYEPAKTEDIRWGLSLKEANAYVIMNRPDLSADDWAKEVHEYALALFRISETPKAETDAHLAVDEAIAAADDDMDKPLTVESIPF